ncbi:MAG TPA: phage holin family protein [Gemmatimonadales bacterium]|jgi:putative membrane protein|nr:phage holin family protein [Gemmatimonadales bacterium]
MRLVLRLLINAAALLAAVYLIPGMHFTGGIGKLLIVAAVFGLVNALVRPILTVLSCPLIVVTLGLFMLVINAALLRLTAWLSAGWNLGFAVDGWIPAILGGLVIGIVSTILTLFVGERRG